MPPKSDKRKAKTSLALDPDIRRDAKIAAEYAGVSFSEAVEMALTQWSKPWLKGQTAKDGR